MKLIAVFVTILAASLTACTDEDRTRDTLHKAGFTSVKTGGSAWGSCSRGDHYATEFVATNPAGQRVGGVVCCGVWKSCTVRF